MELELQPQELEELGTSVRRAQHGEFLEGAVERLAVSFYFKRVEVELEFEACNFIQFGISYGLLYLLSKQMEGLKHLLELDWGPHGDSAIEDNVVLFVSVIAQSECIFVFADPLVIKILHDSLYLL